jgi:hypothetical protein
MRDEAELGRCLKRKKTGGAVDEPRHAFFMSLNALSSAGQKERVDGGGASGVVFLSSSVFPVHPRFGPLVQEMARWEGERGGAVFTFDVDAHNNKRRCHPEFKCDGMKREKQGPALTATCMAPGCEGSKPHQIDYTIRSR